MNRDRKETSLVSTVMEAIGLSPRKRLGSSGVRYLGMGGAIGRGEVRHCSTWDLGYKLPRTAARNSINDFVNR